MGRGGGGRMEVWKEVGEKVMRRVEEGRKK